MKQLPTEYVDQLALGGSMVNFISKMVLNRKKLIPIGEQTQKLVVVHKTKDGNVIKTPVMSVVGPCFYYWLINKGIWQVTIGRRAMSGY